MSVNVATRSFNAAHSPYSPEQFAQDLDPLREQLLAYACRMRPCRPDDAEDLVGDAVRLALLLLERFDPLSCTLSTWLTGILKIVILRNRENSTYWTTAVPAVSDIQIPSNPTTLLRDALQPHIDLLNWHLRDALNLHLDGYPQTEIAKTLHVSPNTVALRIGLAAQELKLEFPDFEDKWDMGFFNWCAQHASYHAPPGMSETWHNRHPRDKALQPCVRVGTLRVHPHWAPKRKKVA